MIGHQQTIWNTSPSKLNVLCMEKRNSRCKQLNDQGEPIKTIEHVTDLSVHMS